MNRKDHLYNIKSKINNDVFYIAKKLKEFGFATWLVGGSIRDIILNKDVHDFDLCTDAKPDDIIYLFEKVIPTAKVIPTGIKHGTVTIMINGNGYEITTLRGETTYQDGRHPDEVKFIQDIKEDLLRRDFTINAIAYNLNDDEMIDPFNGIEDLKKGIIKAVGNALDRFNEDALRILRALRFSSTLNFDIEENTKLAIVKCNSNIIKISNERIRDEILKGILSKTPSKMFRLMLECELLGYIFPEFIAMIGCEQNQHHEFDVWEHTLVALDNTVNDAILRFAVLLHDVAKPIVRTIVKGEYKFYEHEIKGAEIAEIICNRLKFSNENKQRVVSIIRNHLVLYDDSWTDYAVRKWVRKTNNIEDILNMMYADIMGKGNKKNLDVFESFKLRIQNSDIKIVKSTLAINGNDIMKEFGLVPGKMVGKLLKLGQDIVDENPQYNEKYLLLNQLHIRTGILYERK